MLNSLDLLQKEITDNINNGEKPCKDCPVAKNHTGPVFIKHEGKTSPQVVIISESPAGFGLIKYDFTRLDEWIENTLKEIKTFHKCKEIGQVTKLGDFLACLTENRMVNNPEKQTTTSNIYWTHAVKCFIQQEGESLKDAKERLGNKFNQNCKCCCEYVKKELEIIKPELILAIGNAAFYYAIVPKKVIGKPIRFPNAEVVYTYHPNAKIKKELKERGFKYAKERIMCYL